MSTPLSFASGKWSSCAAAVLSTLACIGLTSVSPAQTWTTAAPLAETSYNTSLPQVSSDGLDVWGTLWSSPGGDAYFARSSGTTISWGAPSSLASHSLTVKHKLTGLAADSSGVWIGVGARSAPGSSLEVFRSADNALTWGTPQVVPGTETCYTPSIAASNSGTWIIAVDKLNLIDSSKHEAAVVRTTNKGIAWSAPVTIAQMATTHTVPLATSGNGVWVALSPAVSGASDAEIAFNRSADDGVSWGPQSILNADAATETSNDDPGGIATDGNGNWVAVWLRTPVAGSPSIMAARSIDNGVTWLAPATVSGGVAAVRTPTVTTDRNGNWTIIFASGVTSGLHTVLSSDAAASWTAPVVIAGPTPVRTDPGVPSLSANAQGKFVTAYSYGGASPTAPYFSTTTIIPPPHTADVGVTMTSAPDPVDVGTTLTYTITVENHGPDAATNVAVVDTLPASVEVIDAVATKGLVATGAATITDTISMLSSGEIVTITVRLRPLAAGTTTNAVAVTATENDPVSANNLASVNTQVQTPTGVHTADVAVSVEATPEPVTLGSTLTYTIVVTNNGPDPATNVSVTDMLPDGVEVLHPNTTKGISIARPGTVGVTIDALNASESATITVQVRPLVSGPITNTAVVSATELDPVASNNTAVVNGHVTALGNVDLTATWQSAAQSTRRGRTTFTGSLLVKNQGSGQYRSSTVRYYSSSDTTWSPDDTPLMTSRVPSVRPATTRRVQARIRLPQGVTLTGNYVVAVLDPDNLIPELNETNNTATAGPIN